MKTGYRVYYNKDSNEFVYEDFKSEVNYRDDDPELSSWVPTIGFAKKSVSDHNRDHIPYLKKCKQCGKPYLLKPDEIEWFKIKGLNPPSRCKICRRKKDSCKEVEN